MGVLGTVTKVAGHRWEEATVRETQCSDGSEGGGLSVSCCCLSNSVQSSVKQNIRDLKNQCKETVRMALSKSFKSGGNPD